MISVKGGMLLFEAFAEKVAIAMKKVVPERTSSVEIMKYGLLVLMNGLSVIILSLCIATMMGILKESIYTMLSITILRLFAGGFHFKSSTACILFSTLLIVALPTIPISHTWTVYLTLFSVIILWIFAPSGIYGQTRISKDHYPVLRWCSIIIVAGNFFLFSDILAKSFFTSSLLTVKLGGNRHAENC